MSQESVILFLKSSVDGYTRRDGTYVRPHSRRDGSHTAQGQLALFLAPLAAKPVHQTETPEFKRWFGDSKVVDAHGMPMVAYHGTHNAFGEFKSGGAYFSADQSYASWVAKNTSEAYGGRANVMPVYLAIQNPAILDVDFIEGLGYDENAIKDLERQGYDGAMTPDKSEIFAFRPEQIKSAIANSGAFDPNSRDITKAIG